MDIFEQSLSFASGGVFCGFRRRALAWQAFWEKQSEGAFLGGCWGSCSRLFSSKANYTRGFLSSLGVLLFNSLIVFQIMHFFREILIPFRSKN
jgi:hypothetical protein